MFRMLSVISKEEILRLRRMFKHERRLVREGFSRIAGVDEAGRGPLAGPVVCAACILPSKVYFEHLNDSKQVAPVIREVLYGKITGHPGVRFAVSVVDEETIDRVNILQASFFGMGKAVRELKEPLPEYILVDGNQAPVFGIPALAIIEGDSKSASIAAASIIAKVTRDRIMVEYDKEFPEYGFKRHKGYATEEHLVAIEKYGPCSIHRKSFDPIKSILNPEEQISFLDN